MTQIELRKPDYFDITRIFECGQCFRYEKTDDNEYEVVAYGRFLKVKQTKDRLIFFNTDKELFTDFWSHYFDLYTDYGTITKRFSSDAVLTKAANFSKGIRILRQDPWETLCSFIVSQNNNIPRIKSIIKTLCLTYGTPKEVPEHEPVYAFPTPKALYEAGVENLYALKTGFRAKYLFDAAKTLIEQPDFLQKTADMDTASAAENLMQIKGVGVKVAACTLLFGFARYDAFPCDVWIKRVLKKYYPTGVSYHLVGEYAGIAQQYLFDYERRIARAVEP